MACFFSRAVAVPDAWRDHLSTGTGKHLAECSVRRQRRIQARLDVNFPQGSLSLYTVLFGAAVNATAHRDRGRHLIPRSLVVAARHMNAQGFGNAKACTGRQNVESPSWWLLAFLIARSTSSLVAHGCF